MRNEREQIVGVGNILAEGWKVIAINTESVTLQHESSSLQRRLWLGGGVSRAEGPPVAEPAVQVSWKSPRRVELDGEFSVVLYLRGVEVRKGALTIDYDPAALRMVDASGQWEDNRGSTRLQVTDIGDGEDLVELAFRVIAQAPTSTRLRIRQIEFLDAGGAPIPQPSADDARIDIVAGSGDK
jgi:hypothetical protein